MPINKFIKEVMGSSLILKEEILDLIKEANSNDNIFEIYLKKENDVFFELDFRIKKTLEDKYVYSIINQEFENINNKTNFVIHDKRMFILSMIENIKKKEVNSERKENKMLKRSFLISSDIYEPENLWVSILLDNYRNKTRFLKNNNYYIELDNLEKLIDNFVNKYTSNVVRKIFIEIKNNTKFFNEFEEKKLKGKEVMENLNKLKSKTRRGLLDKFLDFLEIILFIKNDNKNILIEKINNLEKIINHQFIEEEKLRTLYLLSNQKIISLMKDLTSEIIINNQNEDILNRVRETIGNLDLDTNSSYLLLLDAMLIFSYKKFNVYNDLTIYVQNKFIENLIIKTEHLNIKEQGNFLNELFSPIKDKDLEKFKVLCLEEITKQKNDLIKQEELFYK